MHLCSRASATRGPPSVQAGCSSKGFPGRKTLRRRGVLFPRQLRTVVFLPWGGRGKQGWVFRVLKLFGEAKLEACILYCFRDQPVAGASITHSAPTRASRTFFELLRRPSVLLALGGVLTRSRHWGRGKIRLLPRGKCRSAPGRGLNNTRGARHWVHCSSPVPAPTGVIFSGRRSSHQQWVMPFDCWASPGIS